MNYHWSKSPISILVITVSLILLGAGCSINLGGSSSKKDGGVFRSDDHGQTWRAKNFISQDKKSTVTLNDVSARDLFIDPSDNKKIFLSTTDQGIWLTTNGGDQWQATSLRTGGQSCISIDPNDSTVIYTASGINVWKSIDAGKNWKTVYTEPQKNQIITCVVVDPSHPEIIWTMTSGGKIMRSDNRGFTWALMTTLAAFTPRYAIIDPLGNGRVVIFTRQNGIYEIAADGKTWRNINQPLKKFKGGTTINDVNIVGRENPVWFLATSYGLLQSTDRGATWVAISTLLNPSTDPLQNVAVNPQQPLEIFITSQQKLHHSIDGGQSWTVSSLPTTRLPVHFMFTPGDPDRLYFATYYVPKKK